ncbi:MAG: hypothetical protein KKA73_01440 [Chloroflexi bacterium]|nr:hypothetical protein [Chloroflexota bacterium]
MRCASTILVYVSPFRAHAERRASGAGPGGAARAIRAAGHPLHYQRRHTCACAAGACVGPAEVRDCAACPLPAGPTSKSLLKAAMSQLHMAARAYHRILKLARTIADLADSEAIQPAHVAEAIHA